MNLNGVKEPKVDIMKVVNEFLATKSLIVNVSIDNRAKGGLSL